MNANQLFNWRKQYPDGRLGVNGRECALLPVTVNEASDGGAPNRQHLHLLHRP